MSRIEVESFVAGDPRERAFAQICGLPDAAPELLAPGTECMLLTRDGEPRARLSLGVARDLVGAPGDSGWVGCYEALDAEAGVGLLAEARTRLAARGVRRVLGPMNGNTWMRYRLVVPPQSGDVSIDPPVFAGEPRNPPEYVEHFETAGFRVVSRYESRVEDLPAMGTHRDDADSNDPGGGIRIRSLDLARFDEELAALHAVSLKAFCDNAYYSPIDLETFRATYEPFRGRLDPGLVFLAETADGTLVGFLFAYADPLSVRDGKPTRSILKTSGVVPAARGSRLGSKLFDEARRASRARGFHQAIYALMRADNVSRGMSERRAAAVFRRYHLFQWTP